MLLQVALRLSKIELIHRERSLRRRLLEHLARLGAFLARLLLFGQIILQRGECVPP